MCLYSSRWPRMVRTNVQSGCVRRRRRVRRWNVFVYLLLCYGADFVHVCEKRWRSHRGGCRAARCDDRAGFPRGYPAPFRGGARSGGPVCHPREGSGRSYEKASQTALESIEVGDERDPPRPRYSALVLVERARGGYGNVQTRPRHGARGFRSLQRASQAISYEGFDHLVSRIEAIFKQIDGMNTTQILEFLAVEKPR